MAANVSVIGRTTRVRGRITGAADVQVRGFVEGEITVDGDVLVEAHGMVGASIHGRSVVVRGAVRGDLVGAEAVLLEEGARVVGDVRAPRVAIAAGALVRGFVQTGDGTSADARTARARPAARPASSIQSKPVAASTALPPVAAKAPAPAQPVVRANTAPAARPSPSSASSPSDSGPRRPPPPVMPALKKAKGQLAKKKER